MISEFKPISRLHIFPETGSRKYVFNGEDPSGMIDVSVNLKNSSLAICHLRLPFFLMGGGGGGLSVK